MKTVAKIFFFISLLIASKSSTAQGWVSIATPVTDNLILFDMCFPKQQNAIGYVAGSNYTYNGKARILKTTDAGLTWSLIFTSTVNNTGVLAMDFTSTDNGFAGTMDGDLLFTADGGANWTTSDIDPSANQGEIDVITFYSPSQGILNTSNSGTYLTNDGGSTWVKSTGAIPGFLDVCYASENILFAVGKNQKIYKSTNKGNQWSLIYTGSKPDNFNLGVHFIDTDHGMVSSEEGEVFRTTDGGVTWTSLTFNQGGPINDVLMLTTNDILLAATPGQVFSTSDAGINWSSDSTSWNLNRSYNKIIRTPDGTQLVCGSGSTGGTIMRLAAAPLSIKNTSPSNISMYPNPILNSLHFELNESASITITNMQGKVIHQQFHSTQPQIDAQSWVAGMYFVTIQTKTGMSTQKVIKK